MPTVARKIDADARKRPRQARAVATVDAILTAAAQVLVAWGYEKTTTARVAERAGVSIGSLYQYFPNKEALIAALIEHHADDLVATVRRELESPAVVTLEDGMNALIRAGITAHRLDPTLHRILHEQVPRVGRLAKAMDAGRRITEAIERFLRAHADEMHPDHDPALAAVIIETIGEALSHKAALEGRNSLTHEAIHQEAFSVMVNYLRRP